VPDNLHRLGIELLEAAGLRVTAGSLSREEALAAAADADALIVRSATQVDTAFLEAAPALKAIARAGAGVDNIDLAAAAARGIPVMNTPGGNTIAAAEHTFALMLALARHVPEGHQSLAEGRWDRKKFMGTELYGKTLGIVGLGRIGKAVAKRAQAFEMTTIAYDPKLTIGEEVDGCAIVTLDELYARSDYIALHAPSNADTRDMINAETIAQMKDGVRILNTARGTLLDAVALADAIRSGKVAGAAVDVYDQEPPESGYPLLKLHGIIHTPHLGASTSEAQITVAVMAAEQVRDGLLQGNFRNVVNQSLLTAAPGD
jgi:D-3-phosphoglycerate dehydrogenase